MSHSGSGHSEVSPLSMESWGYPRGSLGAGCAAIQTKPWKWDGAISAWIFSPAQVDALNPKS